MDQTLVGMFNDRSAAEKAAERLVSLGYSRSDISIKATGSAGPDTRAGSAPTGAGSTTHEDAGMMESIGNFFSNMFSSDEDKDYAGHYSEAVRRGSAVLTLTVASDRVEAAHDALDDAGAIDVEEKVAAWKSGGYSGYDPKSAPYDPAAAATERETVIPVIEESLDVGKRKVAGGTVRVVSHVSTMPVHESVDLTSETATIERRPVDRSATDADLSGFGDRTIEVAESSEKAVVQKTARVVEEVVVGKQVSHETQTIDDNVRRTEVEVDRTGTTYETGSKSTGAVGAKTASFADHDALFRQHHQSNYLAGGGTYQEYEPSYRTGYDLRSDSRYAGKDWNSIEPNVRTDWESRNPGGKWESMKGAVKRGWDGMTS